MANGPSFAAAGAIAPRKRDAIDKLMSLQKRMNALAAEQAKTLERGRREMGEKAARNPLGSTLAQRAFNAEVAASLNISARAAENLIGNANVLVESLPGTLLALSKGTISYRHATAVVEEAAGLPKVDILALEAAVLPRAGSTPAAAFARFVRLSRERLNPETLQERQQTARENRGVSLTDQKDGMSTLQVELPSPQAHAIFNRLTTAANGLRTKRDGRTLDQRRADVLTTVMLAKEGGMPFGVIPNEDDSQDFVDWFRGIRAHIVVTVPVMTLLGKSKTPATMDGVVPIDPATARRLTANTPSLYRVLTHPETGVTLSVGRDRYKIPKGLRRYLEWRDVHCRFPGCSQPAARCDIDHTQEWQHQGETDHANLACLCRGDHSLKGETEWKVTQAKDGSGILSWTSPTGRVYTTYPEHPIAG